MTKNNKKASKNRRVLIAALLVGAIIVAGSTFAWFSSKDEVTNRLSASAEYGVAIAENFQSPEQWVPGQEINKDASAVNTGNVDAFVRMWLDGNMRLLQQNKRLNKSTFDTSNGSFSTIPTEAVTDGSISSMGFTMMDSNNAYYKTLDKTQTQNPGDTGSGYGAAFSGPYSEVQAMQGSRLAYAPAGASYAFVLKEETTLPYVLVNNSGTWTPVEAAVPAGTLVIVNGGESRQASTISGGVCVPYSTEVTVTSASGSAYTSTKTVYITENLPFLANVEYESFTPFTDGLYLFLRNEDHVQTTDPEFSGYYVTGLTSANKDSSTGTYYALNTNTGGNNRSDYSVKGAETATADAPITVAFTDGVITSVTPSAELELFTASYHSVDAANLKWYAKAVDTTNKAQTIYAVYDASSTDNAFTADDDIVVEITLANIDTDSSEAWTSIGNGNTTTAYTIETGLAPEIDASKLKFYYNNDVEAGNSTAKLVDKVKLYEGVTNKAYLAFDFDLNVHLESVQVTFDENGKEMDTAIKSSTGGGSEIWKSTAATGGATGAATNSGTEITKVTWTATT